MKRQKRIEKDGLQPGLGFTPETKHLKLNGAERSNPISKSKGDFLSRLKTDINTTDTKRDVADCSYLQENPGFSPCSDATRQQANKIFSPKSYAVIDKSVMSNDKLHGKNPPLSCPKAELDEKDNVTNSEESHAVPKIGEIIVSKTPRSNNDKTTLIKLSDDQSIAVGKLTPARMSIRKGASLETGDLEEDTIHAVDATQEALPEKPSSVPANFPRVSLEKGSGPGCLLRLCVDKQEPEESSVFIQHPGATDDPELGDRFGATVKTNDKHGSKRPYYQHFFTKIEKNGVAEHMKIRPGDQFVLLNGVFVPDLDHSTVIQLLSRVPVDSRSRLSLVLLRRFHDKTWQWISTSAILVPEYSKEPALRDPKYRTSKGFSTESRGLYRFKVQGTDLYLTISDEQVQLEVSKYVKDMNKYNIHLWAKCQLDNKTMEITYTACLYREDPIKPLQNNYVAVNDSGGITTKNFIQWFKFASLGNCHSFEIQGSNNLEEERKKWLGCDVSKAGDSGTLLLKTEPYFFSAYYLGDQVSNDNGLAEIREGTEQNNDIPDFREEEGTSVDPPSLRSQLESSVESQLGSCVDPSLPTLSQVSEVHDVSLSLSQESGYGLSPTTPGCSSQESLSAVTRTPESGYSGHSRQSSGSNIFFTKTTDSSPNASECKTPCTPMEGLILSGS